MRHVKDVYLRRKWSESDWDLECARLLRVNCGWTWRRKINKIKRNTEERVYDGNAILTNMEGLIILVTKWGGKEDGGG